MAARREVGYLPENVALYPAMRVSEYLRYRAMLEGLSRAKARPRISETVKSCFLEEVEHQIIGTLSKGYRQRVGLAQALVHDPEVLILDEPTIGLDPKQILEVRELILSLGKDHTVVLSTHILPEVSQICSRVIIINEGCIVAEDTPEHLTALVGGGQRLYLELDVLSDEIPRTLTQIPGIVGVRPARERGYEVECAAGVDCRVEIARRRAVMPSMSSPAKYPVNLDRVKIDKRIHRNPRNIRAVSTARVQCPGLISLIRHGLPKIDPSRNAGNIITAATAYASKIAEPHN